MYKYYYHHPSDEGKEEERERDMDEGYQRLLPLTVPTVCQAVLIVTETQP